MSYKDVYEKLNTYLFSEEAIDARTPFLQFCVRMFLTAFLYIYLVMLDTPFLFVSTAFIYIGMILFILAQAFLKLLSLVNGEKAEYILPALIFDVIGAHAVWLCDPHLTSPMFIIVVICTFGNSLQIGKDGFKYICLLSLLLTGLVLFIRIKTFGWAPYHLSYFVTGACMVGHVYILLFNINQKKAKINHRNTTLAKVNDDLVTEIENRKKAEQTLRDSEKALKKYQDSLEEMVKQRTKAYEHANKLLKLEIESRVLIEKELLESKNRYRDLFENVSDYLIIHDFDGKIMESNLNFKKELQDMNMNPDEVNAKELFLEYFSQQQLDSYLYNLQEHGYDSGTISFFLKSGSKVIMDYKSSIIYNAQGIAYGVQGVGIDITERWLATKKLKETQQQLENIIEFLPDATLVIDKKGTVIAWNLAMVELTGIPTSDMLGKYDNEYSIPLYGKREKILADYICSEESIPENHYDFVQQKKQTCYAEAFMPALENGKGAYIWTTASPLFDDNNSISGAIQSFRDITDRKKAEEKARSYQEQLFQAAKMTSLGTLVAGVAHEINNPVSSIILNAPMLRRIADNVEPLVDDYVEKHGDFEIGGMNYEGIKERVPVLIDNISSGAHRIKAIVNELKDYSRETKTEMTDSVDINSVVTKASELVAGLIKKTTNTFELSLTPSIPTFSGNNLRLEQVVINLLINACQSLPDTSSGIFVKTDYNKETDTICVEIKDEGIGMPSTIIEQIKDPFFTTKRDSGGTGLGLSISERIIREHKGSLSYDSKENAGTTAILEIPLVKST